MSEVVGELRDGQQVVRAEVSHLPAIVDLLTDDHLGSARERPADDPAYAAAFEAIAADPNQLLAVVLADETVVGTLQLTFIPGLSRGGALRAQIEGVRVAASQRGSGLGSAAFEWAIEYARERGAALVQLTTDKSRPQAKTFYERLGFVASHEGMKLPL
ncbi:GNAT family N-acetyltransferase [Luteipulveratus flavus]|uniref:GNAT family N-acetyltransferase n=1 Tax=Luteipulveratus flavus TaxID=3031728 RepID=A0ABT6CAZ6_9MICO|nr:GNAT family N-acetyltransferase [Luteipulveratus sp. YIM 133296]MDF8265960.1 GNAT family N-acetyltransferase [Luteipulveratus sp. YIM 133296]